MGAVERGVADTGKRPELLDVGSLSREFDLKLPDCDRAKVLQRVHDHQPPFSQDPHPVSDPLDLGEGV
jgi:hypothetical protein